MMANGKSCIKCGQYWLSHLDSNGMCCSCKVTEQAEQIRQEERASQELKKGLDLAVAEVKQQAEQIERLKKAIERFYGENALPDMERWIKNEQKGQDNELG